MDLNWLRLYDELSRIDGYLNTLVHPNLVLARVLDATNVISSTMQTFNTYDDLTSFATEFKHNPNAGTWEIVTTAALAGGYGVLAIAYLMRYAILIVLAITAPVAALLFMLPETS